VIWSLYLVALADTREHLVKIAEIQTESAEAIGLENVAKYGMGAEATTATLSQIEKARAHSESLGQTGEVAIARVDGEQNRLSVRSSPF